MQLHRLRLLNFRQHEDTTLSFGQGLTGIVGPNGAGKTTVLEALAWALYGTPAARGSRDSIKRRGAPPRARVEVQVDFSLGPHRYQVQRTLTGAELYQDGGPDPVANSIGAVTERVGRLLGMNREEFFNTYFTGQKDLAIMGAMTPMERSKFLSRVLGYERLREAQTLLRERRSVLRARHEAITEGLPSAEALAEDTRQAGDRLADAKSRFSAAVEAVGRTTGVMATAKPRWEEMQALQDRVRSLESDLRVAEHQVSDGRETFQKLDLELAEALSAKTKLAELLPRLEPLPALVAERDGLDRAAAALATRRTQMGQRAEIEARLTQLERQIAQLPDEEMMVSARTALATAQQDLAAATERADRLRTTWTSDLQEARTKRQQLLEQYGDLEAQCARLVDLGPDGVCPTCNRALGEDYQNVVAVIERQMKEVKQNGTWFRQRIQQLEKQPKEVRDALADRERHDRLVSEHRVALGGIEQKARDRGALLEEQGRLRERHQGLSASLETVSGAYDEGRHTSVRTLISELEPLARQAERLRGAAERAERLAGAATAAEAQLTAREDQAKGLREQLGGLGWSAEVFEDARTQFLAAERAAQEAETAQLRADAEVRAATEALAVVERRRAEREERLKDRAKVQQDLLLNQELDRALTDLRTDLNATLRPDLSDLASTFLRDLTGGRYAELELNDDYEPKIIDDGEPLAVISGGEEDVVNLSLRLAISQMIAERAGQPLALLVLDEIFGSLDEERRAGVVELLRRLADRFPQVILITHIESVRDGFDRVIRIVHDLEQGVSTARDEALEAAHAA